MAMAMDVNVHVHVHAWPASSCQLSSFCGTFCACHLIYKRCTKLTTLTYKRNSVAPLNEMQFWPGRALNLICCHKDQKAAGKGWQEGEGRGREEGRFKYRSMLTLTAALALWECDWNWNWDRTLKSNSQIPQLVLCFGQGYFHFVIKYAWQGIYSRVHAFAVGAESSSLSYVM